MDVAQKKKLPPTASSRCEARVPDYHFFPFPGKGRALRPPRLPPTERAAGARQRVKHDLARPLCLQRRDREGLLTDAGGLPTAAVSSPLLNGLHGTVDWSLKVKRWIISIRSQDGSYQAIHETMVRSHS